MQRLDWGLGQAELGGCRALGGEMRYHVSLCMRVCTCVTTHVCAGTCVRTRLHAHHEA